VPDDNPLGNWEPSGQMPVDQAGAGRRGYVLSGESADVTAPGLGQISLHTLAENNFYREQTETFLITQRYETHTLAVGYRRGFKLAGLPRFELGAQLQVHQRDDGVLNGFIVGFEDLFATLTGRSGARNQLRLGVGSAPPLGTFVTRNSQTIYEAAGGGTGFGDISLVAKAILRDSAPASGRTRVAARVVLNRTEKSEFTEGNFVGFGLSADKKLSGRLALHGDVHATKILDRVSQVGLPLKPVSFGFSAGPELRLLGGTSVGLQIDGNSTPYEPTGVSAFDTSYGAVTLGVSHTFRTGSRELVLQTYGRENMNLPFYVRWNTDPDFSVGLKLTIR
jgi:hypothetical protein